MGKDKTSFNLRRILNIKWSDAIDNKISNKNIRIYLNNIRKVESVVAKKRLAFIDS